MNFWQSASEAEVQRDASLRGKSSGGSGMDLLANPCSISSDLSPSESRTLHDKSDFLVDQDPEKDVMKNTGEYAKYAGEPPDGGLKAWTVLLATSLTTCATFGYVNAWGIFQEYYQEVILPNETRQICKVNLFLAARIILDVARSAWIGSVQYALIFLPGLVTGRLFDLGYFKIPYFFGTCLLIVCTFLVAECKVYWQFFLAQGLGVGLACGILFGPALGIVSHWFSKRRGLALGVTAIGSSVGGTVFPIAAQKLLPEVGHVFKWTIRVFGFILILLLGVANLMLDRRLPPANVKGGLFNWAAFKNPAYFIYCVSGTTTFLGLYVLLTYIPISAVQVGVPNDFAFYLVAIANGASAFGRILAGLLADRVGAVNVMAPFIVLTATVTFVWPFATSKGALIVIAVIYGFSCGTYVSLLSVPAISMGAIEDVGRRTGLFLSFAAFGTLAGPPIAGAIDSATGGFENVGWYAGGILLLSVCLLLLARYLHLGKLMGKF